MFNPSNSQKGQVLILIAIGIVGLIGITALAIDGGNAFSERRHAQNAADTASMAGALEIVQDFNGDSDGQNWYDAASALALANGYIDTDPNVSVIINNPPQADCNGSTTGPYYGQNNYVQVIINQEINTYFASIIGIKNTHSCVEAIAHATPQHAPFGGSAIIALSCDAKWGIEASGSTSVKVYGGGLYSNSSNSEPIYILTSNHLILETGYKANMVGCPGKLPAGYPNVCGITQRVPCPPLPPSDPLLPDYECDYYYETFSPNNGDVLDPGVYCISGKFNEANFSGTGVSFVMLNRGITWQGNSNITLSAVDNPDNGMNGILFYLPPTNNKDVTINGTSTMNLTGTILAPSSRVTLNGTTGADAFHSSVIGDTVKLTGDGVFNLDYETNKNYNVPPQVELTK